MAKHQEGRSPYVFFILTIVYSWLIWSPSIITGLGIDFGFDAASFNLVSVMIGAFGPLAAALTLVVRRHGWKESWPFIRQALDFKVKPVYILTALAVPLALNAMTHYLAPLFNLQVADDMLDMVVPAGASFWMKALAVVLYFVVILIVGGGQEEFGWRGYAQQPLQERFGVVKASLLIGAVWGMWHLPLWIMPGDGHSTYSFLPFLIVSISQSVIYGVLYTAGGQKLIIPLLFHAMHNTAPGLFPILHLIPGKPENGWWLYVGVNVVAALIAVYLMRGREKRA